MSMMFNSLLLIATKAITIMVIREEVQDTVAHQVKEAAWPVTSFIVTLSSGITIFWNNSGIVSDDSSSDEEDEEGTEEERKAKKKAKKEAKKKAKKEAEEAEKEEKEIQE